MIQKRNTERNMNRIPEFLKKGDTVAIVSPSGPIDGSYIEKAKEILTSWGLLVEVGKFATSRSGVFAGTDEQRSQDFQQAISNEKIKAIICSRGGYGAIRIVETLDYTPLISNPKWIVGFSDITVFHSKLSTLGIATIHGAMPKNFSSVTVESLESLKNILFGIVLPINWESSKCNKIGTISGKLVGGNLSILYSLRGLNLEYDYSNTILCIEDLNEYLYHIDRMMQNLKLSGILGSIKGLIVGTMSDMKNGVDEYGTSVENIILDAVKEYNYPVCFNFPTGHESLNSALIFGGEYTLEVSAEKCGLYKLSTL